MPAAPKRVLNVKSGVTYSRPGASASCQLSNVESGARFMAAWTFLGLG